MNISKSISTDHYIQLLIWFKQLKIIYFKINMFKDKFVNLRNCEISIDKEVWEEMQTIRIQTGLCKTNKFGAVNQKFLLLALRPFFLPLRDFLEALLARELCNEWGSLARSWAMSDSVDGGGVSAATILAFSHKELLGKLITKILLTLKMYVGQNLSQPFKILSMIKFGSFGIKLM